MDVQEAGSHHSTVISYLCILLWLLNLKNSKYVKREAASVW